MSDVPDRIKALSAETEQTRFEFLQSDVDICFTFIEVAQTELGLGDRDSAAQALERAQTGLDAIERLLPDLQRAGDREEIERKMERLRGAIAAFDSLLASNPGP